MSKTNSDPIITNTRYRLGYHISAPFGWINDPNGFCFFKGYYHVFYQYHPHSVEWGPMHWGHVRSKDLVHWEQLPIALYPGDEEDPDGCFSGSAVVKDGRLYLMYTGQHLNNGDPDDFWETQNLAVSDDGIHFTKYQGNPVIATPPVDNTADFRDPKVWFDGKQWLVVIGSKDAQGLGRVLLYRSDDLINWTYLGPVGTAKSVASEGYVWECPDFFELDHQQFLLVSPQGIEAEGLNYRNLFQTGYFTGSYDATNNDFQHGAFTELDHGHDFYATQTMLAPDGRRLLIGWMDMWENEMPEQQDGWSGALTMIRELSVRHHKLIMQPIRELQALRSTDLSPQNPGDTSLRVENKCLEYLAEFNNSSDASLKLCDKDGKVLLKLDYSARQNTVSLMKDNDDLPRTVAIEQLATFDVHLLIDNSSIEIFTNQGEACFTERIYPIGGVQIEVVGALVKPIEAYQLKAVM